MQQPAQASFGCDQVAGGLGQGQPRQSEPQASDLFLRRNQLPHLTAGGDCLAGGIRHRHGRIETGDQAQAGRGMGGEEFRAYMPSSIR